MDGSKGGKMKLETLRNKKGKWFFRLKNRGRVIMHSEDYASKASMMRTVKSIERFTGQNALVHEEVKQVLPAIPKWVKKNG